MPGSYKLEIILKQNWEMYQHLYSILSDKYHVNWENLH